MPGPLLPIISRLGASLVGRSAAALAGTKAAAGAAVGKVKATALSAGTKARATLSEGSQVLTDAIKSRVGQPTPASERAKSIRKLSTPMAEQVEGKSLKQKADFFRKTDNLLGKTQAAALLNRDPGSVGLEERVEASSARAEQERLRTLEELNQEEQRASETTKKWSRALKFSALSPLFAAGGVIAYKKLGDAVDGLTSRVLAGQEPLAKFSGMITSAFAILRRRQLGMQIGRARATEGSTALLANAVGDLKEALEPMRRSFTTIASSAGTGVAVIAAKLAELTAKYDPMMVILNNIAGLLEAGAKSESQRLAEGALPFKEHYQELLGRGGGGGGGGGPAAEDKADAAANLAQGDEIAWSAATREEQRKWLNRERMKRKQAEYREKHGMPAFGEAGMPPF